MTWTGQVPAPPGGQPTPYNPSPPSGYGGAIFIPLNPSLIPGQLPGDPGAGTGAPAGGDTQVGYPATAGTPAPVTSWTFEAGTPISVSYIESGASSTAITEAHGLPPIKLYLSATAAGPSVPGSVRFQFRGRTYVDRAGSLYYDIDPITNAGTLGGSYDYDNNVATLTDYAAGSNTVTIISMATRYADVGVEGIMFRTPGAPLRIGAFTLRAVTIDGTQLTASVDVNGVISGTDIKGQVDWQSGLVTVAFGAMVTAAGNESEPWYNADLIDGSGKIWKPQPVDPSSIFFGTVIYHAIPVDPTLIGLDPVRLPSDGRVNGFNAGAIGVLSHTQTTSVATPVAGATENLGRTRISFIEVKDSTGTAIDDTWYTLDLDAGTVTWSDPLNLSAYTLPVEIRDRIQDVGLITDVQITGEVTLASGITHDFPADAVMSCAILATDKQSRVNTVFDQQTYQAGVWKDIIDGSPAAGTYNTVTYPIQVTNDAAIDERWAFVFKSATTVDVIGETVGQVLTGVSITADIAPVNPVTISGSNPSGTPYFTVKKEGWGGGWAAGNLLRMNTVSATIPVWSARTVTPGELTENNDAARINWYGNAK